MMPSSAMPGMMPGMMPSSAMPQVPQPMPSYKPLSSAEELDGFNFDDVLTGSPIDN
jgi:hypothetical protein